MNRLIALFTVCVSFLNSFGQEMITDFISYNGDKCSTPSGFVTLNNSMLFASTTEDFGREIWILNENQAPVLLKDINPGPKDGILADISNTSVVMNHELYFIASDGQSKGELWKTDGTNSGTLKITSNLDADVSKLTLVGDKIYFLKQRENELQVWFSDGTHEGTIAIDSKLNINASPIFQGKCNGLFSFAFQQNNEEQARVWVSDGTTNGTIAITEPLVGNSEGINNFRPLSHFIELKDKLYFCDKDFLYQTDGTGKNTIPLYKISNLYTTCCDFGDATHTNGTLYFSFYDYQNHSQSIISTEGSKESTHIVYQKNSDFSFMPSNLLAIQDELVFTSVDSLGHTILVKMNIQNNQISKLVTLTQSPLSASEFGFNKCIHQCQLQAITNTSIYCAVPQDYFSVSGWISNLTSEGTRLENNLQDVYNGYSFNNSFYFSHKSGNEGSELWKLNPTNQSLSLVSNINNFKYGICNPYLTILNTNLIFTAGSLESGNELWTFNGQNSVRLKTNTNQINSGCHSLTKHNNSLFFISDGSSNKSELWQTNGDINNTHLVCDLLQKHNFSNPSHLFTFKEELYFTAENNNQLFLCKKNNDNMEIIAKLAQNENNRVCIYDDVVQVEGQLFFITHHEKQSSLWISNGTSEGTKVISNFAQCCQLTSVGNQLFFAAAKNPGDAIEIWTSMGSADNTKEIEIEGSTEYFQPDNFIALEDKLLFTAYTEKSGRELWISDGTNMGTHQLFDINPGINNTIQLTQFCKFKNEVYFNASDGLNGTELWKTDGTALGTLKVKEINSGAESSNPSHFTVINNHLYFQAYDSVHGRELWKTDGSESGTTLVADVFPGINSSSPSHFTGTGNTIYFLANSPEKGRQIWKLNDNATFTLKNNR